MYETIGVLDTFQRYIGSSVWMVFFCASVFYIFHVQKKENKKYVIILIALSVVLLYNDFIYKIIGVIDDSVTYYRFMWLIPVVFICAYAMVHFITNAKISKSIRGSISVAILVIIFITQESYLDDALENIPSNKYLMWDEVIDISEIINKDFGEGSPVIAAPFGIELMYNTYSKTLASMAIGDTDWLNGTDTVLEELVGNGVRVEKKLVREEIDRRGIDYFVIWADMQLEDYMESVGCEYMNTFGSFQLYRYVGQVK